MKTTTALFLFLTLVISSYGQGTVIGSFNGSTGSFRLLLDDYAEKAGKRIEVVEGVYARIKFHSEPLSVPDYLKYVDVILAQQNIALYPIGTDRLVATWLDPNTKGKIEPRDPNVTLHSSSTNRSMSYVDRLRLRREAMKQSELARIEQATLKTKNTIDKEKLLREYNLELIRAKGEKGKPLPIKLTPEEDARLVEEGILPPLVETSIEDVSRSSIPGVLPIHPKNNKQPNEN